jgi:hypothetical protein
MPAFHEEKCGGCHAIFFHVLHRHLTLLAPRSACHPQARMEGFGRRRISEEISNMFKYNFDALSRPPTLVAHLFRTRKPHCCLVVLFCFVCLIGGVYGKAKICKMEGVPRTVPVDAARNGRRKAAQVAVCARHPVGAARAVRLRPKPPTKQRRMCGRTS